MMSTALVLYTGGVRPKSPSHASLLNFGALLSRPHSPEVGPALKVSLACEGKRCTTPDADEISYCCGCERSFCSSCWSAQEDHRAGRSRRRGKHLHEKNNPAISEKVLNILYPTEDQAEMETLYHHEEGTAWFGVDKPSDENPMLQDYGCFMDLMNRTNPAHTLNETEKSGNLGNAQPPRDDRTPSLVSFIGDTGAGKSTIVKLLIDLSTGQGARHPTPVIGPDASLAPTPTTGDIHLYLDPKTSRSSGPTLYADSEGLTGGHREPREEAFRSRRWRRLTRGADSEISSKAAQAILQQTLSWAADDESKRGRQFLVTNLYPRLLYAFSDVIVFVLRNQQSVESVFDGLITWASQAIESSSNQALLPHAVLILNASKQSDSAGYWDVTASTQSILDSLASTIHRNPRFKRWVKFWLMKDKMVDTLEELVLCYYSSIQIVRMPDDERPQLMAEQIDRLHSAITTACIAARCTRQSLNMLLDVDDMQQYLVEAFKHYSTSLTSAFNFAQASYRTTTIPPTFAGNITKLALNVMELWPTASDTSEGLDIDSLFREISYVTASAIMLDSVRRHAKGLAEDIFPHYVGQLREACTLLYNDHWPCEFSTPNGTRCVNLVNRHSAKGHQAPNGSVIGIGEHECLTPLKKLVDDFTRTVYFCLSDLLSNLDKIHPRGDGLSRTEAAAGVHRNMVLSSFVSHIAIKSGKSSQEASHTLLHSHTACFCCLFEQAENCLPCGHVVCTSCIRIYGKGPDNNVGIMGCPFERSDNRWNGSHFIRLQPRTAGVRVMSLDGGGIRGIVELEALRRIEQGLGGNLRIQSFFDLIVGTSTGGLVALGLGEMGWSVDESIHKFTDLCGKAFKERTLSNVPLIGWLVNHDHHSKYQTTDLQHALVSSFTRERYLFGGISREPRKPEDIPHVKVAVTAASIQRGKALVLANYNRSEGDPQRSSYIFNRPEKMSEELKIWEAARATSAAPEYFKSFHHEASQWTYVDGAVYHNNPVVIADSERQLLWPNVRHPDFILSIGTGIPQNKPPALSKEKRPTFRGAIAFFKSMINIVNATVDAVLDCEKKWTEYAGNVTSGMGAQTASQKLFRLNPPLPVVPKLDDKHKVTEVQEDARIVLATDPQIDRLCRRLIASSFYFKPDDSSRKVVNSVSWVQGRILCRLPHQSSELKELGKHLKQRQSDEGPLSFQIWSDHGSQRRPPKVILWPRDLIDNMAQKGEFRFPWNDLKFSVQGDSTQINLTMQFGQKDNCSISGFPRSFASLSQSSHATTTAVSAPSRSLTFESQNSTSQVSSEVTEPADEERWEPPRRGDWSNLPELTAYLLSGLRSGPLKMGQDSALESRPRRSSTPKPRYPASWKPPLVQPSFQALFRPVRTLFSQDRNQPGQLVPGDVERLTAERMYYAVDEEAFWTYHSWTRHLLAQSNVVSGLSALEE